MATVPPYVDAIRRDVQRSQESTRARAAGLPEGFRLARPEERVPVPPELQPQPRPGPTPPPEPGILDWLTSGEPARRLSMGAGDVVEGVGDLFGLVANPLNTGLNMTGLPQLLTGQPLGTDLGGAARELTGTPTPETTGERIASAINQGGSGAFAGGAVGSLIRNTPGWVGSLGGMFADDIAAEVAGGVGASVAQDRADAAGLGVWGQLLAGLGGGVAGGYAGVRGQQALGIGSEARAAAAQPRAPEDMIDFALDGPAAALAPNLAAAGVTPAQASAFSPEFAEAALARIAAAQARPAIAPEVVAPSARAMPAEVPIFGQEAGPGVRADDIGGMMGEARFQAMIEDVLARAEARAADNPTMRAILDSSASAEQQAASVFRRLEGLRDRQRQAPVADIPTSAIDAPEIAPAGVATRPAPRPRRAVRSVDGDFERMLVAEGGTNPDGSFRTSPAGAIGPAQVMPGTAPEAARLAGLEWDEARYRSDPAYNTALGRAYHREMLRQFGGDRRKAAAAYNAGPGGVQRAVARARERGGSWESYLPAETQGYLGKVFGDQPMAPQETVDAPFRAGDEETIRRRREEAGELPMGENRYRGFEDTSAPESPTIRQREEGDIPPGYQQRAMPQEQGQAFRVTNDDPMGDPGFWERRAEMQAEELRQAWEAAQAETRASAAGRREQANASADADASTRYAGRYDQKPTRDGEFWRFTDDGFVAGAKGQPVAFRSAREAAKWAASNKMGGDVEPAVWSANSTRVVLRRRPGSTYGSQAAEPAAEAAQAAAGAGRFTRTDFERDRPAAPFRRPGDPPEQIAGAAASDPEMPMPPGSGPAPDAPPSPAPARTAPFRGARGATSSLDEEVTTADGMRVNTRFEVVDAADLRTSADVGFDQANQPRNRSTNIASDAQIADIAARLDPMQLGRSRLASQGAPIVGRDGAVDSGNGRVMALRRAYDLHPERAAEYRRMVEDMGFDTAGMERPVLIRRVTDDMTPEQRRRFTVEAQDGGTSTLKASEQGAADAAALTDDIIGKWRGGTIRGNSEFARLFLEKVAGRNAMNEMVDDMGAISPDGVRRIEAAMVGKAYGRKDVLDKLFTDTDTEIKALGNVLTQMAPRFAQVQARIRAGEIPEEFDIAPDVAEAALLIARQRAGEGSLKELFTHSDMFGGDRDPMVEAVAQIMMRDAEYTAARPAAGVAEGLNFYLDDVEVAAKDLFGSDLRARALEIARAAGQHLRAKDDGLFGRAARPGASRQNFQTGRPAVIDVMHGAAIAFDDFDPAVRGKTTGAASARAAFWFTDDRKAAQYYARISSQQENIGRKKSERQSGVVMQRQIEMRNPLVVDNRNRVYREESFNDIVERAKAGGHDGVILQRTFDAGEYNRLDALMMDGRLFGYNVYAVFEPSQIVKPGAPFPLRERLLDIARTGTREQADLALRLREALPERATVQYGTADMIGRNRGEAEPSTMRTFVADAADVETVLHEAVHLASVQRYGSEFANLRPGERGPARDFLDLYHEARSRVGEIMDWDTRYALSSPDEFLAMSLTNQAVQDFLKKGTLWNRFVDGIRRLLGLEPRWRPMLDDVLRAGRGVIDSSRPTDSPAAPGRLGHRSLEDWRRTYPDVTRDEFETGDIATFHHEHNFRDILTNEKLLEHNRRLADEAIHDFHNNRARYNERAAAGYYDQPFPGYRTPTWRDRNPNGRPGDPDAPTTQEGFADGAQLRLFSPTRPSAVDRIFDRDGLTRDAARLRSAFRNPKEALRAIFRPTADFVSSVMFTNDARIRGLASRFKSPTLERYADLWHARSGVGDGTQRTYHEAIQQEGARRLHDAFEVLEPFSTNAGALRRIQDMLRFPDKRVRATAAEIEAAKSLRGQLQDILAYRRDAFEDIGEVGDGYFPRIINPETVVDRADEFKKAAERLYRSVDADDPRGAAEAWFEHVFDTYAGVDGGLAFARPASGGVGTTTAQARAFGKEADRLLADFYEQDTSAAMSAYITGSVRRAEHARRFGLKGATDSAERKAWVEEHGGKTQWDVMADTIAREIRDSGEDAAGVLDVVGKVHRSNLGVLGAEWSSKARGTIGAVHAWNQISVLDRAVVTSLSELAMGFVRGGPRYGFKFVADGLRQYGRQLRGADPDDATRWAQAIGVAQDAMVNQMLMSRAGIEGTGQRANKLLANFHRATTLHQFTEGTRTAATTMGRAYIDTLAGDLASANKRVQRRAETGLRELGVTDPQGFARDLRDGRISLGSVQDGRSPGAQEYATALIRFVNQTIMAPSRAEKPTYASHPVGSLFYSLMSWSYGFKKNVLDRTGRMAIRAAREKDPALLAPAAGLAMMAAFTYFNDTYVRPGLFGSRYDFDNETAAEAVVRTADRAGLLGAFSPVVNAFRGFKYDRSLAESAAGAPIGRALDAAGRIGNAAFGRNSTNTNTAERHAAGAVYDAMIEPALDAFAASRLRGMAATAGVLSTGNREGGVLAADRDFFVDAVAGEQTK